MTAVTAVADALENLPGCIASFGHAPLRLTVGAKTLPALMAAIFHCPPHHTTKLCHHAVQTHTHKYTNTHTRTHTQTHTEPLKGLD